MTTERTKPRFIVEESRLSQDNLFFVVDTTNGNLQFCEVWRKPNAELIAHALNNLPEAAA